MLVSNNFFQFFLSYKFVIGGTLCRGTCDRPISRVMEKSRC